MNKMVTNVIFFVSGAVLGGAATYILVKKRFEDLADKEISEMRAHYIEKRKEIEESKTYAERPRPHFASEDSKPDLNTYYDERILKAGYKPYNELYKEDGPSEDETRVETEHEPDPYEIDEESYKFEAQEYEKRELRLFEDDTLCNEEDEIIEMNIMWLTEKIVKALKDSPDGIIYVRNDTLHEDAEIQLINGSYKERILGEY